MDSALQDPLQLNAGIETIQLLQNVRYSLISVACLIVYEWLVNFPDEIRLIHASRWSSVKVVYMLCRYYPLLYWPVVMWAYCGNYPASFCKQVARPVHAFIAPFHFLGQSVMFMRAYAFSGRNRTVLVILSASYSFLLAADIYLFFVNVPVPNLEVLSVVFPNGGGCFADYTAKAFGTRIQIAMTAALFIDLLSLVIVILYCIKKHGHSPLAIYFLKQGLIAFAWISVTEIASVTTYFRAHNSFSGVGLPFTIAMSNLFACRLILSLRSRVNVTDTQISRDHSRLVRDAFATKSTRSEVDIWDVQDPIPTPDQELRMLPRRDSKV